MVKPLRLPLLPSFLSLSGSLSLVGVLLISLTRSARVAPVVVAPLLSRSLPFCAVAGMVSKETTSTAREKYFSFFTEASLIRVPADTPRHSDFAACLAASQSPRSNPLSMRHLHLWRFRRGAVAAIHRVIVLCEIYPTQTLCRGGQSKGVWELEAEVVELVAAFGDDLVLVDPDVAVAG